MQELIKRIAQALVDNPEQVSLREITGEHTIIIELKVAKEDIGKVIGKQGRTGPGSSDHFKRHFGKGEKTYHA